MSPEWSWTGQGGSFNRLGSDARTAGDVDGDGFSDILVTSAHAVGSGLAGGFRVYYGSTAGPGLGGGLGYTEVLSPSLDDGFAAHGADMGDVNGDGYDDVAVSAMYGEPVGPPVTDDRGLIYVYFGSATGLHTVPDQVLSTGYAGDHYGRLLSRAGDVDGDGFSDLLVASATEIHLHLGSSSGLSASASWFTAFSSGFSSIDALGDVDADGFDDFVLGEASHYNGAGLPFGRAWVFFGSSLGPSTGGAREILPTDSNNQSFGAAVCGPGDVDGDGYADLLVADPHYRVGSGGSYHNSGRVYLHLGGPSGPSFGSAWTHTGGLDDELGWGLSTSGDTNGDGYADFVVGTSTYFVAGNGKRGKVELFLGGPSGPSPSAERWIEGLWSSSNYVDFPLAVAGDVDGDGFSDWITAHSLEGGYGAAHVFRGTGAICAAVAQHTWLGGAGGDRFGSGFGAAGDVDGDGYQDLLVGMPGAAGGKGLGAGTGRASLFLGSATGPSATAAWSVGGASTGDSLGAELSLLGDVNGDGRGEIAVAAPYSAAGGELRIYAGVPGLPSTTATWTLSGTQAGEMFGYAVTDVGDIDGDGYADVAVGSPGYDDGGSNDGRVQLFLGSASGLSTTAIWSYSRGGQTGWDVAFGDLDGDGLSDLAVSSPATGLVVGTVDVFYGSANGFSAAPDLVLGGSATFGTFGWSLASGLDVNADGAADLLVSAPNFGYPNRYGRAYLYLGSTLGGLSGTAAWWKDGWNLPNEEYGLGMAGVGDLDGDGASDFAIGGLSGSVDVFLGVAFALPSNNADLTLTGASADEFGRFLGGAGDVDGDGFDDLVVGSPAASPPLMNQAGAVRLYRGNSFERNNDARPVLPWQRGTGGNLVRLARSRVDRVDVGLTAHSAAGRTPQRLEVRHAHVGTHLRLVTPAAFGSWLSSSTTSLQASITGLSSLNAYHWQARAVARNPRFPHGPWVALGGAAPQLSMHRTAGSFLCPDLTVATVLPDTAFTTSAVTLDVSVANLGAGDAPATLSEILLDGVAVCGDIATPSLPGGSSTQLSCAVGVLSPGAHQVEVRVDVAGQALESNEANNTTISTLQIVAPSYLLIQADGSGDVATLADAFAAIAAGGIIELADGTYTGAGNREVNPSGKECTVRSQSGDPLACVLDAQGSDVSPQRILSISSGEGLALRFENLGFTGAYKTGGGGAVLVSNGSQPVFQGCRFFLNHAANGAAIFALGGSDIVVDRCVFDGNDVTDAGAAMSFNTSAPSITGCTFSNNTARWGGALYFYASAGAIATSVFRDNVNPAYGGAIEMNQPASVLTVAACTFYGNGSPHGANVYVRNGATLVMLRCILAGGSQGPAIGCDGNGTTVSLTCSDVFGNAGGDYVGCIAGYDLDPANDDFSSDPYFCDVAGSDFHLDSASPCTAVNSPCGFELGAFGVGCGVVAVEPLPERRVFGLEGVFPNPFNPHTVVRFSLEREAPVHLDIFDLSGRRVSRLVAGTALSAGEHRVMWDGMDDHGRAVASGVYVVRLEAAGRSAHRKLALVR